MTNEQLNTLRQIASNYLAAMLAAVPSLKNTTLGINTDAGQVSIQWQYIDSSVASGAAVIATSAVCKTADLPAAQ